MLKGAGGPRIFENTKFLCIFHGLDGVVKGTGGPRIIANTQISLFFHGLAVWLKALAVPESLKIYRFVCIFKVWAAR